MYGIRYNSNAIFKHHDEIKNNIYYHKYKQSLFKFRIQIIIF